MNIHKDFDNKIIKTALMTLFIALICVIIPVAITSYAAENEIEVSKSVFNLTIGQTAQIDAKISSGGTLNYKSENESICTVDEKGLVTALDTGSTRVVISTSDGTAEPVYCEINVNMINEDSTKVIFDSDTYTYTGYRIEPHIEVYYGETLLEIYKDYDTVFNNNTDVGTASVTITGMANKGIGKYSGELTTSFTIVPKNINDVIIFDAWGIQTYKGTPITPDIDAFINWDNHSKLVNGKDYTLTYTNNINVGTATVTVKGIGNFTGEKAIEFIIYAADINFDVNVTVENVTYTGSAVTPDILAIIDDYKLVLGKDYTLSYSNNINIGTATITITGIENVTGVRVIEFKIIPKANGLISYSNPKKTSLRLDWTMAGGITGYKIYVYDFSVKKYVLKKTINDPNTLHCTVKGLTAGETYNFKIATYLTVDGVDYISNLSANVLETMTVPADSKIVQLIGKNHSVQIRWKKINGASGYIIYRYKKNSKKYVRIAKIAGNTKFTYTNKNLKKSKTYKYKVIAYKQLNGKTLKGKMSAKKSVLTLSFRWPVPGFYYISQKYNNKSGMYASGKHSGTDIASNGKSIKGAKIIATKGGIVDSINKGCKHNYGKTRSCGCGGGFGNYVVVRSTVKIDGKKIILRVIYGHMTSVKVKVGQYISSGQMLGTVGSTGYSTGPHLHFEFRVQDNPSAKIKKRLNPLYYVKH